MSFTNEQEQLLGYFRDELFSYKEDIEETFRQNKGLLIVEIKLKREFFPLIDNLKPIIDEFRYNEIGHLILKDDEGEDLNYKCEFYFRPELGFIEIILRFTSYLETQHYGFKPN